MPYANEVALDECNKRGIEVMFGWEMIKIEKTNGVKIATFKNGDRFNRRGVCYICS